MGKLKNRTKLGDAVDNELYQRLCELSATTRIPRSRLLDDAIALLLETHEQKTNK